MSFFSLLFVFFIFTNYLQDTNDISKLWMYIWEGTTKRTGPNDAFHVVWAFSEFFILLFVSFISTNYLTGINDILKIWMYLRGARRRERAQTTQNASFGPLVSFFKIICVFYIY